MSELRKGAGPNAYIASGPVSELSPGRRTVKHLELRLGSQREDLTALTGFADLEELRIVGGVDLDLTPLASMRLFGLTLIEIENLDFESLAAFDQLEGLMIDSFRGGTVPATLELSPKLYGLTLREDGPGSILGELVKAIDWAAIAQLETLILADGGPVMADLGFLRRLPSLQRLELDGVVHDGSGPSPLDPPHDGLATTLDWIRAAVKDPQSSTRSLAERAGFDPEYAAEAGIDLSAEPAHGSQSNRRARGTSPSQQEGWTLKSLDGGWTLIGRFGSEADGTEYDAADEASQTVKDADVALWQRIEFDPEADGTQVNATSREDLLKVADILELPLCR